MKRVKHGVLLAIAAATVASGCTTFSDNDAVARVDDIELSSDELSERIGTPVDGQATSGDAARDAINGWILEQLSGNPADVYPLGLEASGSVCVQVMVVDDQSTAETAKSEITDAASFASVFAARNVDPSLTLDTSNLGCLAASELPIGQGNPFVDSLPLLNAQDGVTSAELTDQAGNVVGHFVARFIPFDELTDDDITVVAANQTVDPARVTDADVYIDPRYGAFDPQFGAVPLG